MSYGAMFGDQIVTDPEWLCPADVMRGCHYWGLTNPVRVVRRGPDGQWQDMPGSHFTSAIS